MRQALAHLALQPGAVAQRRDADPHRVEGIGDALDEADRPHPRHAVQRADLGRHLRAVDAELRAGHARAHQRPDLGDEPLHRVGIGRVAEAAEEADGAALGQRNRAGATLHHPGDDADMADAVAAQDLGLDVGMHDHAVGRADRAELLVAHRGDLGLGHRARGADGPLALEAEEMQVRHVVDDARARCEGAAGRQVARGDVEAVQVDDVELVGALAQHLLDRPEPGMVQELDAEVLQVGADRPEMGHVVGGDEGDLAAQRLDRAHMGQRSVRTCILARRRRGGVHEEHAELREAVLLALGLDAVQAVVRQHVLPAHEELAAVDHLVALHALREVGAAADALEVRDHRTRLVDRAEAGGAHAEGEVGVLVVARRQVGVEAAHLVPDRAGDHQRRARDVVGVAQVVEARVGRVLAAAVVPAVAEAPDDAARLLQLAVAEQQLRAGDADPLVQAEGIHQRIQREVVQLGVVVEEEQVLAARRRRAAVAAQHEAEVLLVAQNVGAGQQHGRQQRLVRGAVVDDDDLVGEVGSRLQQRLDAVVGELELVVDGDDDGDVGPSLDPRHVQDGEAADDALHHAVEGQVVGWRRLPHGAVRRRHALEQRAHLEIGARRRAHQHGQVELGPAQPFLRVLDAGQEMRQVAEQPFAQRVEPLVGTGDGDGDELGAALLVHQPQVQHLAVGDVRRDHQREAVLAIAHAGLAQVGPEIAGEEADQVVRPVVEAEPDMPVRGGRVEGPAADAPPGGDVEGDDRWRAPVRTVLGACALQAGGCGHRSGPSSVGQVALRSTAEKTPTESARSSALRPASFGISIMPGTSERRSCRVATRSRATAKHSVLRSRSSFAPTKRPLAKTISRCGEGALSSTGKQSRSRTTSLSTGGMSISSSADAPSIQTKPPGSVADQPEWKIGFCLPVGLGKMLTPSLIIDTTFSPSRVGAPRRWSRLRRVVQADALLPASPRCDGGKHLTVLTPPGAQAYACSF